MNTNTNNNVELWYGSVNNDDCEVHYVDDEGNSVTAAEYYLNVLEGV